GLCGSIIMQVGMIRMPPPKPTIDAIVPIPRPKKIARKANSSPSGNIIE
ncbi:unnamed protein product, partial [marine sediment metagenome]